MCGVTLDSTAYPSDSRMPIEAGPMPKRPARKDWGWWSNARMKRSVRYVSFWRSMWGG